MHLLDKFDTNDQELKVFIGKEMENEILDDYSLVVSKYKFGSASGSIGIIGPKRMPYSKIMTLVKYASALLNQG